MCSAIPQPADLSPSHSFAVIGKASIKTPFSIVVTVSSALYQLAFATYSTPPQSRVAWSKSLLAQDSAGQQFGQGSAPSFLLPLSLVRLRSAVTAAGAGSSQILIRLSGARQPISQVASSGLPSSRRRASVHLCSRAVPRVPSTSAESKPKAQVLLSFSPCDKFAPVLGHWTSPLSPRRLPKAVQIGRGIPAATANSWPQG